MDPDDDLRPTPEDLEFEGVTSRYIDIEDVVIDPAKVPERFRHLIDYAKYWSIGDDVERSDMMWLTPPEELKAFVTAVSPLQEEIYAWCSQHHNFVPVPDEVVVFDMMLDAVAGASACFVDIEA